MNKDSFLQNIVRSIQNRGVFGTFKYVWYDLAFDMKYGIKTLGRTQLEGLTTKGSNVSSGHAYQGFSYLYFKEIMKHLPVKVEESTFIDFGCGKGRILIMASEHGFNEIIGVEFIVEFYEACMDNLNRSGIKLDKIEVLCDDAVNTSIPKQANVMCFFNPFEEEVMDQVLENIDASIRDFTREVYLLNLSPTFTDCFEKRGYESIYELSNNQKLEGVIYKK
ncbi:MAG: class I SAM-dependent methyltransferase [Flavobacteriales bacterium]|nr:class I SAM-dependent methyltransferase [Flavobacteriales bacterium]